MIKYIMANIFKCMNEEDLFVPSSKKTLHEEKVKMAIEDQNLIGWHQYLRGLHSKLWNEAHIQWIIESHQQNLTHLWNIYAILNLINLSITNWAEKCIRIRKIRKSPEHESILIQAKKLLHEIRNKSILDTDNYSNLHKS